MKSLELCKWQQLIPLLESSTPTSVIHRQTVYINTLNAYQELNSFEEPWIMQVATVNSFTRKLNLPPSVINGQTVYINTLNAYQELNSFEEPWIMQVATVNSFTRELNPPVSSTDRLFT